MHVVLSLVADTTVLEPVVGKNLQSTEPHRASETSGLVYLLHTCPGNLCLAMAAITMALFFVLSKSTQ